MTNKNEFYAVKFKLVIASFLSEETKFFQLLVYFPSPSDDNSIDVRILMKSFQIKDYIGFREEGVTMLFFLCYWFHGNRLLCSNLFEVIQTYMVVPTLGVLNPNKNVLENYHEYKWVKFWILFENSHLFTF